MVTHNNNAVVYFRGKTSTTDGRSDRDLEIDEQVLNYLTSRIIELN